MARVADGPDASALRGGTYASTLFAQFVAAMEAEGREPALLDLGPTTPQNLMFWAERGFRVTARDVLGRLPAAVDIPAGERFGGILCWNVLSALERDAATELMGRLRSQLQPGGPVFAIFDGDGRHQPPALRYRIAGPDRLQFEILAPRSPLRAVANSEIESVLQGFRPTRLTVMRHGSREALGFLDSEREPAEA